MLEHRRTRAAGVAQSLSEKPLDVCVGLVLPWPRRHAPCSWLRWDGALAGARQRFVAEMSTAREGLFGSCVLVRVFLGWGVGRRLA